MTNPPVCVANLIIPNPLGIRYKGNNRALTWNQQDPWSKILSPKPGVAANFPTTAQERSRAPSTSAQNMRTPTNASSRQRNKQAIHAQNIKTLTQFTSCSQRSTHNKHSINWHQAPHQFRARKLHQFWVQLAIPRPFNWAVRFKILF